LRRGLVGLAVGGRESKSKKEEKRRRREREKGKDWRATPRRMRDKQPGRA
jgi:hypothetical protein